MRILSVLLGVMLLLCSFTPFEKEAKESEEGRKKYEQGDMESAQKQFEKASERLKKSPQAYFDLGNARLKAGKNEEALDAYRKSLETGKADRSLRSGIYHNMGNTFASMGKLNDAEKMFVKSLIEEPSRESAENLEIVRRMIKQQQQQQQQQKQDQQKKDGQQQENQEKQEDQEQKSQDQQKQEDEEQQQKEQEQAQKEEQEKKQEEKQAAAAKKEEDKEDKEEEDKEKGQLLKQFKQRKNLQISPFMLQKERESDSGQTW